MPSAAAQHSDRAAASGLAVPGNLIDVAGYLRHLQTRFQIEVGFLCGDLFSKRHFWVQFLKMKTIKKYANPRAILELFLYFGHAISHTLSQ